MPTPVVLPKQGQSVESCIITQWNKRVGETVTQGEVLCEVETDKAVLDVESPAAGVLLAQFFAVGDDVPVLTTIAAIGQPGEDFASLNPVAAQYTAHSSHPTPEPAPAIDFPSTLAGRGLGGGVGISPRARNLAARREVDVSDIQGTGPEGRIIERDILAALNAKPRMTPLAAAKVNTGEFTAPPIGTGIGGRITTKDLQPTEEVQYIAPSPEPAPLPTPPPAPPASSDDITVVPLKGVRKLTAARMLQSMQTTAQLTLNTFADARTLQQYRQRLKDSPPAMGLRKASINDLMMFAVSRTLPQYPELNALFSDDTIYQYKRVHLGFAVDTPRGLLVPVIHNADVLTLKQLAMEAMRLATACSEGKITPDEMRGGTFTVSNLGSFGIETFTPIANPPQIAILGVGNIHLRAVEINGAVQFIPHIGLSLTINHQVVDGAPAARFLQSLSHNFANIDLLMAL